jgi:hypothetical protein
MLPSKGSDYSLVSISLPPYYVPMATIKVFRFTVFGSNPTLPPASGGPYAGGEVLPAENAADVYTANDIDIELKKVYAEAEQREARIQVLETKLAALESRLTELEK